MTVDPLLSRIFSALSDGRMILAFHVRLVLCTWTSFDLSLTVAHWVWPSTIVFDVDREWLLVTDPIQLILLSRDNRLFHVGPCCR